MADGITEDTARRMAKARQWIAHQGLGSYLPCWDELTPDEQEQAETEARHWIRAAVNAGVTIVPACRVVVDPPEPENDDRYRIHADDADNDQLEQAERAGVNPYTPTEPAPARGHISIMSFGFLHSGNRGPTGIDLVLDVRDHFRDPHIDPRIRYMTARDQEVVDKVLSTEGVRECAEDLARVLARLSRSGEATAAIGCAGGRHRAPAITDYIADYLTTYGYSVEVTHRDIDKPVVERVRKKRGDDPGMDVEERD